MSTILVIAGEAEWTRRAVHLAAAAAREAGAAVVLLHLVPVAHLEYLGTGGREALLSFAEFDALNEYAALVAAYGVAVRVELFEYSDLIGGAFCAADQYDATAVFAAAPGGLLGRLRLWSLRRALRRPLYTLGDGDPTITITAPPEEAAAVGQPVRAVQ